MTAARLVCIEGIDGAGKTSLVDAMLARQEKMGLRATRLHLPSLLESDLADRAHGGDLRRLTEQELAFVSYSRLYDFYLTEMVPALDGHDLLLLDRFKWSFMVRWACRDVRWSVLTALGSIVGMLPEPALTILLDADPFTAYRRKVDGKLTLTPAETLGRRSSQSAREAFVNLQTRACDYYQALFERSDPAGTTRINTKIGQAAVADEVEKLLRGLAWPVS